MIAPISHHEVRFQTLHYAIVLHEIKLGVIHAGLELAISSVQRIVGVCGSLYALGVH